MHMNKIEALLGRLAIDLPIVQAPMAAVTTPDLVAAVANAGGLGSHGCAMLTPDQVIADAARVRALSNRSFNLGFFCHEPPVVTAQQEAAWLARLKPYYEELGLDAKSPPGPLRMPFDDGMCEAVEAIQPKVVSFHFGLPPQNLVERVKAAGCVVISSATTVEEARRLADRGCDAVVAQGFEAGGHRGMFLTDDVYGQVGTLALVPQIVDAVDLPVIAAGGIADGRGVAAALALGAAAVQVGTAYMFCPEANVSPLHRAALAQARDDGTVLTNVFTGRPARSLVNRLAREIGPMSEVALPFPATANAVYPLRAAAERQGSADFTALWAGQAARLGSACGAAELTRKLSAGAAEHLRALAGAVNQIAQA
jgi:nitronate monooxygenase